MNTAKAGKGVDIRMRVKGGEGESRLFGKKSRIGKVKKEEGGL